VGDHGRPRATRQQEKSPQNTPILGPPFVPGERFRAFESGAGYEVIMRIAGHVSRAMLSRYSHMRMEAKRCALDEIASRQRAAEEKRRKEAERREQGAVVSQSAVIQ
jgi:hypothetical protein